MTDQPRPPIESQSDSLPLRLAALPRHAPTAFALTPDPEARARIAQALGIEKLRKMRFVGTLSPTGRYDWALSASLGATAVQACVVSGDPVTTRVDTEVERLFVQDMPEPTESETEIPEDDRLEPLPVTLDLGAVMAESLALELPDYPRAPDAAIDAEALGLDTGADDGPDPDRPNPFAVLAKLKKPE